MSEAKEPFYPCAHIGCFKQGIWLPMLAVRMNGHSDAQEPIRTGFTIFLCDDHRINFQPAALITPRFKIALTMAVYKKYGKRINWDTMEVEWRREGQAQQVLMGSDGQPLLRQ